MLAGYAEPSVCYRRVAAVTALAAGSVRGRLLAFGCRVRVAGLLPGGALPGLPLARIRRWLASQEINDPVAILRTCAGAAEIWADDLDAVRLLSPEKRGSFYFGSRTTLERPEPAMSGPPS